ncbi:MAG: Uma2 family endonuclease [Candidatus Rokubacteria bacterium]|nr:Uma2 family endonuclease [Candidatus Rokubacteria bacterium]
MAISLVRRAFTVEEYYRMAEAGILHEDDRVELLEGEIVEMAPIGDRHAQCVDRLTNTLAVRAAGRAIVRVQGPVRLSMRSEPQPDIALLRFRPDFYPRHPGPADVLLLIEVAETSLETDRAKVPLYARAGIAEVWLVDLAGEAVEVFREPGPGGYGRVERVGHGGRVTVPALPDVTFPVDEILG